MLATGAVSTIAGFPAKSGKPGTAGYVDGTATTQALFNAPNGLAIVGTNLYVADTNNNVIREVSLSSNQVTTLAGFSDTNNANDSGDSGYRDGAGSQALFGSPIGLAADAAVGNIYVADMGDNMVRKITPTGVVSTVAGKLSMAGFVDGPNALAQFNAPNGLVVDSSNNIYVADANLFLTNAGHNLVRKISSSGIVTTMAGQVGVNGTNDGTGSTAQFFGLQAIAISSTGDYYIADTLNNLIRKAGYAPAISTQPFSQIVTIGQTASFSATASGSGTLTYQWLKNGSNITGATSASYSIPAVASGDAGNYTVTVTSFYGTMTSSPATLIPVTAQPVAQTVTAGQSATFSITVSGSGTPFFYQWYKNNVSIPGATGASFTIPNTSASDAGSYMVVVSDTYGTVSSSAVTLTINPAPLITDTPTMPPWALIAFATGLYFVTARFLSKKQQSNFNSHSALFSGPLHE